MRGGAVTVRAQSPAEALLTFQARGQILLALSYVSQASPDADAALRNLRQAVEALEALAWLEAETNA